MGGIYFLLIIYCFVSTDNTCHVTNLTDSRFNIFNFTVGADGGHVKGVKDIFKFGSEFGENYIGGDERVSSNLTCSLF